MPGCFEHERTRVIIDSSEAPMKLRFLTVVLIFGAMGGVALAQGQPRAAQGGAVSPDQRAQAYYNVTMGHLYEQEFESSGHAEDAAKAIDFYKKAYAIDPSSPEIGEDLAEVYFLAHRSREAVNEAEEIIRRNPNDISARRLLARIYIRSLGDLNNSSEQQQTITAAIGQLREIVRLDPADGESALWLARLLRLDNQDDQAQQVLRGVLASDPQNKGAVEQFAQLLLDHNNPQQAISLLESFVQRAPNADLYDRLGEAYQQIQQREIGRASCRERE